MNSRREILWSAAAAALACRADATGSTVGTADTGLPDTGILEACFGGLPGGELQRVARFLDEPERTLEEKTGAGLDARWVLDLTQLEEADAVLDQSRLFVRTEAPLDLDARIDSGWAITVRGPTDEVIVEIDAILAETVDQGAVHIECSGNTDFGGFGLQGAVAWAGVPMAWFLDQVTPLAGGLIKVTGYDAHPPPTGNSTAGAAWVFRAEDLAEAFLATHIGDEPLTPDHGAPVRLVVPGWYGCTCIKWVETIEWVALDEPATSQMQEFAVRTEQTAVHAFARDYAPAVNDVAATPVRVEVFDVGGQEQVRVTGIVWGGTALPEGLRLWADDEDVGLVEMCPGRGTARTWGFWTAMLPAGASGRVTLSLTVDDPGVQTRRLDRGYYARTVNLR